jgi:hypothetical protein
MKKSQIIACQSTLIYRYEELINICQNAENIRPNSVKILRIWFQIQNLKKKLKKSLKI